MDFKFSNFDMFESIFFIKKQLNTIDNIMRKLGFLGYCLTNSSSYKSEILILIGDIYVQTRNGELAERAYLLAASMLCGVNHELFLKLMDLYIFTLKDFVKAETYLTKYKENNFIENAQYSRYAFLVYRENKNSVNALYYGNRMCELDPKSVYCQKEYKKFLAKMEANGNNYLIILTALG